MSCTAIGSTAAGTQTRRAGSLFIWIVIALQGITLALAPFTRVAAAWSEETTELIQYGIGALLVIQTAVLVGLFTRRKRPQSTSQFMDAQVDAAHAARLNIAGQISTSVTHELVQPLSAVLSNVEAAEVLLSDSKSNAVELAEILADIKRDDLRANDIVQGLRSLLRKCDMRLQQVDAAMLVNATAALIRSEAIRRDVLLRLQIQTDLPTVRADPVQLQQVFLSLMLDAMGSSASASKQRHVDVIVQRADHAAVEVAVAASAEGVTQIQSAGLLETLFRVHEKIRKEDLSTARAIVHDHGGTISVQRVRGQGTAVRIRIPAAENHPLRS